MKYWTPKEIIEILDKNDDQVGKALLQLYNRQTLDEKRSRVTKEHNGVGFNAADSKILTNFAIFYSKTGILTEKQLIFARSHIRKYGKQLARIANMEA